MEAAKVGQALAYLRRRYQLTQRQVAEYLGVSDKAVSKWERGAGTPDISLLGRLAMLLDTDIESILDGNITSLDVSWQGVLYLARVTGVETDAKLYDKPAAYLPLSYLMLAGIRDIEIMGGEAALASLRGRLGDGHSLGLCLTYTEQTGAWTEERGRAQLAARLEQTTKKGRRIDGIMLVDRLSFVYGKDLTKAFRRILYSQQISVQLLSHAGLPLGIHFLRRGQRGEQPLALERGTCAFPIVDAASLRDAGELMRIIESRQQEQIADLAEVARSRWFIDAEEK